MLKKLRKRRKDIQKKIQPITKSAIKILVPIIKKAIEDSIRNYLEEEMKKRSK